MEILYTKRFQKHYKKLDSYIQSKVKTSLDTFIRNPTDTSLRNHSLDGEYAGYRSIDVTGDYRVIFHDLGSELYEIVELIDVGTHSQLYG